MLSKLALATQPRATGTSPSGTAALLRQAVAPEHRDLWLAHRALRSRGTTAGTATPKCTFDQSNDLLKVGNASNNRKSCFSRRGRMQHAVLQAVSPQLTHAVEGWPQLLVTQATKWSGACNHAPPSTKPRARPSHTALALSLFPQVAPLLLGVGGAAADITASTHPAPQVPGQGRAKISGLNNSFRLLVSA